ncbi:MAG: preprotein translocase subunit SecE [candidate division Zixibacteria bacterium]|nr:preprotein translocase subunit SecE [candidate division Zixibacteria bacterium]MBU1471436.1 preprotein translocase subunit SecE [candidate division Zixibacteria bacterium]MBU2626791.1 preprotein translocase subunit SecE [candidate division Zixibacteria bacterium]
MKDKVVKYIKETVVELKKVTWPSKQELIGSTIVTIFVSLVLAIFIFLVDQGLSNLMALVLS